MYFAIRIFQLCPALISQEEEKNGAPSGFFCIFPLVLTSFCMYITAIVFQGAVRHFVNSGPAVESANRRNPADHGEIP